MSDFDTVLERLLSDPGFARALAADPGTALAGYRLSEDELTVLRTQLNEGAGEDHAVEARTNQSSLAGMLSPLTSGQTVGFGGDAPPDRGFGGDAPPDRGFGTAPVADQGSGAERGFGTAPEPYRGFGAAPGAGAGGEAAGSGFGPAPQVPEGYETRVDVDGDGSWDQHTLRATPEGGVEIEVDLDGDGRADFVGHDTDADGLVNWSQYDRDHDGTFETRMYDDDGDGWMDRTETGGKE